MARKESKMLNVLLDDDDVEGGVASAFGGDQFADLIAAEFMDRAPVVRARSVAQCRPEWTPLTGVPATRGDCRGGERPCRYVRCRYHLYIIESEDRPGRRQGGVAPEVTLRPGWLESPIAESCALDLAEQHEQSVEEIAVIMKVTPRRIQQILQGALDRLREAGVNPEEQV